MALSEVRAGCLCLVKGKWRQLVKIEELGPRRLVWFADGGCLDFGDVENASLVVAVND